VLATFDATPIDSALAELSKTFQNTLGWPTDFSEACHPEVLEESNFNVVESYGRKMKKATLT